MKQKVLGSPETTRDSAFPTQRMVYELRTYSVLSLLLLGKTADADAELSALVSLEQVPAAPFLLRFLQAVSSMITDAKVAPDKLYDLYWYCERQRRLEPDASNPEAQLQWDNRELLVLNSIASRHSALGQSNLAALVLERVVALRPQDPIALSELGKTYYVLGCPEEARAFFDEAAKYFDVEHNADHCASDVLNRALLLIADGLFDQAAELLRQGQQKVAQLSGGTSNVAITNNIGVCCMSRGQLTRALEVFREAVAARPPVISESTKSNMFILFDLISDRSGELKQQLLSQILKSKAS